MEQNSVLPSITPPVYIGKTLYIASSVYDLEDIFLLTDTYVIQFSDLSADYALVEVWSSPSSNTTIGVEVEKPLRCN